MNSSPQVYRKFTVLILTKNQSQTQDLSLKLLTCGVFLTALKDSSERSINNDWKIELPGEFELAGTTVRYVRRGLWEKMSAKGPTKTPLHLMVNTSVTLFCIIHPGYNDSSETCCWWC